MTKGEGGGACARDRKGEHMARLPQMFYPSGIPRQPPPERGASRLVSGAAGGSFDNERAPGPVPRRSLLKLEDQMKKKSCLLQVLRYTAFVKKTSGNRYKSLNSFFAMQKHSKSGPVPSLTARPGISARGPGTAHMRETSCASYLCSLSWRAQGA